MDLKPPFAAAFTRRSAAFARLWAGAGVGVAEAPAQPAGAGRRGEAGLTAWAGLGRFARRMRTSPRRLTRSLRRLRNEILMPDGGAKGSLVNALRRVLRDQAAPRPQAMVAAGIAPAAHLRMPAPAVAASVVINLLGLALPLVVLEVYDQVLPNNAVETLAALMLGYAGVVVIEAILKTARASVAALGAVRFETLALTQALARYLHAPPAQVGEAADAHRFAQLNAASRIAAFYGGPVRWMILDVPFVGIYLAMMAAIGGPIVLAPIAILLGFLAISAANGRRLRQSLEARERQDAKTYDFIAECLQGVLPLKSAGMEPFMNRRLERLLGGGAAINAGAIRASGEAENLSGALGNFTFVAVAGAGGWLAVAGDLSVGGMAACTLLAGRVVQPVLRAASAWSALQALRLAHSELKELYDLPAPAADQTAAPVRPDLAADFAADPSATPISLSAPFGAILVLTGPDGALRERLTAVLAGRTPPATGAVLYGGATAEAMRAAGRAGLVDAGRAVDMFKGTILDNLTLFGCGPTLADALWAVDLIGLRAEIDRLPLAFDTPLGDGPSDQMPAGFIQRLALARAIACRPQVLVMEEPQALLDHAADAAVRTGIAALKGQMSVIISTARPSWAQIADIALTADGGALVPFVPPSPSALEGKVRA